jgi:hydrogenase 3 maturation protease
MAAPFPCPAGFGEELSRRLREAKKIFVLGIGMDWKSDDRVGCELAKILAKKLPDGPGIRIVDGGEAPENYTGAIRAFAPSHVVLLDAVDHGLEPGAVFLADEEAIIVGDMTSRHLPLKLLMRFLSASIPCRVVLVGVQPASLRPGNRLSPPLRRTLPPLAAFLAAALRRAVRKTGPGRRKN